MNEITDSIKPVIKSAKFVKINEGALLSFTDTVTAGDFDNSEIVRGDHDTNMTAEDHIAYSFILGALQFCFWGDPKWTVVIDGQELDGSAALVRCLKKAIYDGVRLTDARYLSTLERGDLETIFAGKPEIPLLNERLELLRDLGKMTIEKFGGLFSKIVDAASWDAARLVRIMVSEFSSVFNDSVDYHGHRVHFHKRAQIVPLYIFETYKKKLIDRQISGREKLTGLADYKVPQMLRGFGILKYEQSLAGRVDNKIEIPKDSDEEIEIRAHTIEAGRLATNLLKKKFPEMSGALVHKILWHRSQMKTGNEKPYHRTKTIWY